MVDGNQGIHSQLSAKIERRNSFVVSAPESVEVAAS